MGTSFESLVERAKKRTKGRNRDPFVITIEGDDPIEVPYPDAIKSMNYERAETVYDQLRALLGVDFTRILDMVRGKDISVLQLLITEMWDFWDDDSHEVPGGKRGLIDLFDHFGREIMLDFREYWHGLDVLDYFDGTRSWFEFYEYLNGLRSYTRFKSALALDEDYAKSLKKRLDEMKADQDEEDEDGFGSTEWSPETRSQEDFTPVLGTLYSMLESIQEIPRTLIAVNGRKPPKAQKIPRPVSALDILELEDERDDMADLSARFGMRKPG
ncbi:tail assembly chaperone [Gordonia phage Patio]|uniref:Tail assembly chaperone n=1 Tax=Gordonia phage Patio TaxID=2041515 RepID=A0A2D2W4V1_9CAUD|nr:tail assembly chaperone [Gordonia phage Patio]ATS93123.1 tail assembly chaperone [Gordonia phage Patio]